MSLTLGTGPFGRRRSGRFDFEAPEAVVYVEPFPRRVRAVRARETVIDCDETVLVHETGKLPHYAFPVDHVHLDADAEPHARGYVVVPWESVDAWYEEDERVEVHPRDPYHRIDTFSTSRRLTVSIDGIRLADSTRARALYETGLPTRWYLPLADVERELLERSTTITECAYKGAAIHWSARIGGQLETDIAWTYERPRREAEPVRSLMAFYDERVDVDLDGERQERPRTQWSQS